MSKEETIIDKLTSNPYFMELTKEEYQIMQQDEDLKSKVFDFREKLNAKRLSDSQFEYLEKRKQQTELQNEFNDLGGFVFVVYQRLSIMFDDNVLSQEDKSKLLLLSTYICYNENTLRFDNGRHIKTEHLPAILRISRQATHSFLKKMKELTILEIENDNIHMSKDLFYKGEIKDMLSSNSEFGYTRIFVNSYRYLYETLDKRKLKYLGILFNVFGYMNFYHNVLVLDDASEIDTDKLIPMTFDDLCKICNRKDNMTRSAKSKFKIALSNIKLENGSTLFAFVKVNGVDKILINPHVTYASSRIDTWNSTLKIIFKFSDTIE